MKRIRLLIRLKGLVTYKTKISTDLARSGGFAISLIEATPADKKALKSGNNDSWCKKVSLVIFEMTESGYIEYIIRTLLIYSCCILNNIYCLEAGLSFVIALSLAYISIIQLIAS